MARGGNGLYGYSDSSWGDNPDDRHSTTGYVFLLADAAISLEVLAQTKNHRVQSSMQKLEYMGIGRSLVIKPRGTVMFLEELGI